MQIRVFARSTTSNHSPQHSLTITDAQAMAGALINFTVSGLEDAEDYYLYYSCDTFTFPEPCENIVGLAYYMASNQSVFRKAGATVFSGTANHVGVELPIMTGNIISGTMNMPSTQTAPVDGIKLNINVFTVTNPVVALGVNEFIAEGQTMDAYQIMIPNDSSETWEIGYSCYPFRNLNGACDDLLESGYFNSSATNSTAELRADAEALPGGQSSSPIDMTLLNGFTISGILSIPTAPTEAAGIQLTMSARDANNAANNATESITIAQGTSSAPFEITIPKEASADWRIRYDCEPAVTPTECSKYIDVGYFDSDVIGSMTTADITDADQLPGGQSHSGIDFSIISGFAISGKLILSDGVAPAGGVSFAIAANNTSGTGGAVVSQFSIEENQSETSYQLNVETDASKKWRTSFDCQQVLTPVCLEIADTGYFDASSGNTVDNPNNAMSLPGGMNHTNVNLMVESSALGEDDFCLPIKTANGSTTVICL